MDRRIQESKYLTIAIISLVVLLIVLLFVFRKAIFMNSYRSAADHFSIKYPGTWQKEENKGGAAVIFMSPLESNLDTFRENVNVVVQDASGNRMSIEKYTEMAMQQVAAVFKQNIELVESTGTILAGKTAYKYVYIGRGEIEFKIMHVWTISGDNAYQVTYTALLSQYDEYINQVEKMIKSFRID